MICLLLASITGAFAAFMRSRRLGQKLRRAEKIADGGFLLALSGLLARVAMADGEVTADEIKSVKRIFSNMGLSPAGRAMCVGNFYLTQHEPGDVKADAKALAGSLNHISCLLLFGLVWRVANADRRVDEGEERIMGEIGEALGLNDEEIRQTREGRFTLRDRKALEAEGVPEPMIRQASAVDGPKDAGLGIWNR